MRFLYCVTISNVASIEDGYFDLIVTSPPYNIGKAYEKRASLSGCGDVTGIWWNASVCQEQKGSICWQVGNHVRH